MFLLSIDSRWTLVLTAVAVGLVQYLRKRKTPPLPPGPRGLPLLGNIFDVPSHDHWLKFAEMGEIWGDISSLTVFGQTMIIVNSLKVAEDLLETGGANFSDRPVMPMGGELIGFNNLLVMSQYGDRVRKERKLFHQLFGNSASIVTQFGPLLTSEVHKLLRNILNSPEDALGQIGSLTGGITLRIAYGYHVAPPPEQDSFLKMFETAASNFALSTTPAAFLVDIIPALRHWPEWLPGGGFHTIAKNWSRQLHGTVDTGYQYVKNQMDAGTAEPSFMSTMLEEGIYDECTIKWAAPTIQAAGADTTAAQVFAFFLAMSVYPEVQAAAQKEIDTVVGTDRLPDISDRAQLPYVNALCKEVLRWHLALPICVPHRTHADFIYDRGKDTTPLLIPKDSLIIPNIWKMTHDPERYTDPMTFNPMRFIETEGKAAELDPARISFGFGRRICPGKLLAEMTMFMTCSSILSVFDISKVRENGVDVEPPLGQTTGTVSDPLPFKCTVKPRNERASALIHST
ncbi:cytochrome P450 [Mycena galopus ATCC 62051]|nr:cytochrome P450 [Mycena galopus ATCC 62051]